MGGTVDDGVSEGRPAEPVSCLNLAVLDQEPVPRQNKPNKIDDKSEDRFFSRYFRFANQKRKTLERHRDSHKRHRVDFSRFCQKLKLKIFFPLVFFYFLLLPTLFYCFFFWMNHRFRLSHI